MRTSLLIQLATTFAAVNAQGQPWAQCGGSGWTGATTCVTGYTCVFSNDFYSQCLAGSPSSAAATTTSSKTTTVLATSSKTTTSTIKSSTTSPPVVVTTSRTTTIVVPTTTSAATTLRTTTVSAAAVESGLAFPGAEGFGRIAIGGRNGGSVYEVTNLLDSGAGSLRDAVSKPNRLVVFKVGGTIKIVERIVVSASIYIAGQTAPGGGITVYGNGFSFSNAHNSIVRYIRIRMGKNGDSGKDGITIAEGRNMIFDHVSAAWGRDETFSISGTAINITVQNSIIAQGLETHSCGGLMETDGGISLFRNLYIDNKTRNPKVKGVNEFTNNVVYNWGGGGGYIAGDSAGTSYANIINNYFISGPSTSATAFTRGNENFHGFVSNNFYDSNKDGVLNGTPLCVSTTCYSNMVIESTQYPYPSVKKLLSPADAVTYVIANVGNTFPSRDGIDARLITEVKSFGKSGQLISDEKAAPMNGPGVTEEGTSTVSYAGSYAVVEAYVNSLVPSGY